MKTKLLALMAVILSSCVTKVEEVVVTQSFTNVAITNTSKEDSVKTYVTLQAPNRVLGMFGISDTISASKGYFYAHKDSVYYSNSTSPLLGVVVSFVGDNVPCQVAVKTGFPTGVNIFEFSVNTPFEVFDISCEDGVNSIIKASVSDTVNWTTGDSIFIQNFRSAQNTFPIDKNLNIRGVFPYRCTDCIDLGSAIPENCFNLKDTCNANRICQVARTNNNGGVVTINYLSPAWEIAK